MQIRTNTTRDAHRETPHYRAARARRRLLARARHTPRRYPDATRLKLLVAGGGTGGHVFPALAVAKEWLSRGENREVIFVGTARGLENRLVPEAGIALEHIRSAGLKGMGGLKLVKNLAMLPGAFFDSLGILRRHQFSAAFGVGGYAAGPVIMTAALKHIPVVIFEPNAEPGFTNRVLARVSTRVATGYDELARRFGAKAVTTGTPVRSEFHPVPLRWLEPPYRILITGGSQGARALNRAVIQALPLLASQRSNLAIVHQTGQRDYDEVRAAYTQQGFIAEVSPFLNDMPARFAWADLVICRAGQITIAELASIGRPAIFIPFAAAADDHQLHNAQALERVGAARIVQEGEASGKRLADEIVSAFSAPETLRQQAELVRGFAHPDATREIVDLIEQVQVHDDFIS
jgi:UDP-N-acetylglucosamine--N-acetylmuramyl-(pentapeptide) pyrophosphoryl-undecaprenol N-acetylglucosamine transferase